MAATYYVSPSGNAAWGNCTGSTPLSGTSACPLSMAFSNATAGDLVYLRGGTYTISSRLLTSNSGTGDLDGQRIIFRAYTGETPNIVSFSSEHVNIKVQNNYWTFDGITIHCSTGKDDSACIGSYEEAVTGLKIINSHIHLTSATSYDNVDVVMFHNCTSCILQNNDIEGYTTSQNGGLILFNGVGNKVLNNNIHGCGIGIYQKHPNCDTSYSGGAEWAYNYIYNIGPSNDGGFLGRGRYINVHDNIVSNASGKAVAWGIDGGGTCGGDYYMIFNHNTWAGGFYLASEAAGLSNGTTKNNIVRTYVEHYGTMGTWDYNIYGSTAAIGAHDQGNTAVTFVGGANPTTIAGFALAAGSNGKNDGDDGLDLGANVSLVGTGGGVSDTTPPAAPTGVTVN